MGHDTISAMKLLRLCAHEIELGHPLPWHVRNERGQLLLNKGFAITEVSQIESLLERGVYADADEYEQENERRQRERTSKFDPFKVWAGIHRKVGSILRSPSGCPQFANEVSSVSAEIQQASNQDVDVGKFEMVQADSPNYAVRHSLQTAFVAHLVAQRLGGSLAEQQSVISAALSMNIAMIELQNALVSQATPLTPEQRAFIKDHGRSGRTTLESLGVRDDTWLQAVEQHHVTEGGGPLPEKRAHLNEVACLIHYVDVYLAKLSTRANRPAMGTQTAAQQLFLGAGGATNPYAAAIVKEMGIYPPGTFVKLQSGETAVVIRAGESAHTPKVCSLHDAEGMRYGVPIPRDTTDPTYKVVAAVPRSNVLIKLDRSRLLGY
jgi:HD-GYP domain-containing protein (c-di-GMP phosphodiesterase class II)